MTESERRAASEKYYQELRNKLDERLRKDKQLQKILEKIANKSADFNDTAKYSEIVSNHLASVLQENIGEISSPLTKEYVCRELLKDQYSATNNVFESVQVSVDEQNNIQIRTQKPAFPKERVDKVAHALEDPTVPPQTIKRRAGAPVANVSMSFHDDCVRENAAFRSDAGYECYITRVVGGASCPWCSAMAGRYKYPDETPDDIFRRHDNCTCTVTFEQGSFRQDVWSKRSWETPKTGAGAPPPKVFSKEEADRLEQERLVEYRGLTDFSTKPGKNDLAIANMEYINSEAFAEKFKGKYANEKVESAIISACRQVVKNRDGTNYEEAFFIDAKTGKTVSYIKSKKENGVNMPDKLKDYLTSAKEKSIIMIHNHPNSSPLSTDDYVTSTKYASLFEVIASGHNGDVYAFRDTFGTEGTEFKYPDGKKECQTVRDYRIAYTKHKERYGLSEFEARNLAWEDTSALRGFIYEKR